MRNAYKEIFDEVRASGRLRTEVMNMTKRERTVPKRRMPRAAVVAAALVLALAGTALAAEVLGAISIRFLEGEEFDRRYQVLGDLGRVPVEIFSEELLAYAAALPREEGDPMGCGYQRFDSWEEAEAFIGVELAENSMMDLKHRGWVWRKEGDEEDYTETHCKVDMATEDGLPFRVSLEALYRADCGDGKKKIVRVMATMLTEVLDNYPNWCYEDEVLRESSWDWDACTYETYATPSGLEATIVSEEVESSPDEEGHTISITVRTAYFIWNDVFYEISTTDIHDDIFEELMPDPQASLYAIKYVLDGFQP